jgi:hypothetical protein
MKIDATRYNLFWSNPEKYRLREIWKLAPKEPKAGTFASLLTYGRRRGTCFHEMLDGLYRKVGPSVTLQELRDGGFGEKEIKAASEMVEAVQKRYADEEVLAHEVLFESPIPDSVHSLVGRIDRIIRVDSEVRVKDYKTSKHRSKTDTAYKGSEYCRGAQVPFYLLGARALGFDPKGFTYTLVSSGSNTTGVSISEYPTSRTGLQLRAFERDVHVTCELIGFMKERFGVEKSWPNLPSRFDSDYAAILGQNMYDDYLPDGYEPKKEHLELLQDVPIKAHCMGMPFPPREDTSAKK